MNLGGGQARWLAIAGLASIAAVGGWAWSQFETGAEGSRASAEVLALGREIYATQCASCHGAKLEGQPDWRSPLPSGRLPAPPHDASGHTWHHPNDVLFRIVKEGTAVVGGGGYESDIPGFGDVLSDEEIRAVLAFMKSTWPERERTYQQNISRSD
jgi:mono/diheme cytochrome c family protein